MAIAVLGVTLTSAAAPSAAAPDTPRSPRWALRTQKGAHPRALASSLWDDADYGVSLPVAGAGPSGEDPIVVVEATDAAVAREAIESAGGHVEGEIAGMVKASVPAHALDELASAPGVTRVGEPNPIRLDVESQGVLETEAEPWHTAGIGGAGTKVAILDGGFLGYASLLGTELPASVETDFSRCGDPNITDHGTAVAEIVHDMAPDATLRLVCIEDTFDYVSALGGMAANNVDVVNGSFGFVMSGRGDGSGGPTTIAGAAAALRDQGILYVASAGNYQGSHYNVKAAGDPHPEIDYPDDVDLVNISADDALVVRVPGNGIAFVGMQWDAWPVTSQDFDMYIGNATCQLVGASEDFQDGSPTAFPVEGVVFQNCSGATLDFEVVVNRWDGAATPRVDFWFDGDIVSIEHTSSGAVAEPASSSAVMAVGAHCVSSEVNQPYSSRGPTIDGRTKPDISGPDATDSSVYSGGSGCAGGFTGTSASAPHVAGAAALLLEANPELQVAELQQLLEDRAQDAGSAGKDNAYGAGRLRLGTAGNALLANPQFFTGMPPVRLFDSRPGAQYPAESPNRTTPLGPGSKVAVRVRGISGVPADATAVALNVTAVGPTSNGYVTVFPGGTVPNVSNVNFRAGQTAAVHVTATVDADHKIELYNATGSTHVLVDIAGWYGPTGVGGPSTDGFTPLAAPARAMDTRPGGTLGFAEAGPGDHTTPVPAGGELAVQVAGLGGIPAEATAVIMNVTATGPTTATAITAYPEGETRPTTSILNTKADRTVANLVVLPVGDGGVIRFYNFSGDTHVVVDVTGWFQPGVGAGYIALDPPTRDLDTRTGTGLRRTPLGAGGTFKLKVAGYNGVPTDAVAVMLGVAAVGPTSPGYLTIYPGSAALPPTSNINFRAGWTIANAVVSRLGTDGRVAFTNATGTTDVISDLAGYFIDPADMPVP